MLSQYKDSGCSEMSLSSSNDDESLTPASEAATRRRVNTDASLTLPHTARSILGSKSSHRTQGGGHKAATVIGGNDDYGVTGDSPRSVDACACLCFAGRYLLHTVFWIVNKYLGQHR